MILINFRWFPFQNRTAAGNWDPHHGGNARECSLPLLFPLALFLCCFVLAQPGLSRHRFWKAFCCLAPFWFHYGCLWLPSGVLFDLFGSLLPLLGLFLLTVCSPSVPFLVHFGSFVAIHYFGFHTFAILSINFACVLHAVNLIMGCSDFLLILHESIPKRILNASAVFLHHACSLVQRSHSALLALLNGIVCSNIGFVVLNFMPCNARTQTLQLHTQT